MATQTIDYLSFSRICCGTLPADIVICLPSDLVLSGARSVNATLLAERCFQTNCRTSWIYSISVDDTQLIPDTTLSGSEITGLFCKGCLTDWIEDQTLMASWQSWNPVIGTSGTMTFTGVTVTSARYVTIGKTLSYQASISGTIGGVLNTEIRVKLPLGFTAAISGAPVGAGFLVNTTPLGSPQVYIDGSDSTFMVIRRPDASNYVAGTADFSIFGTLELA